MNIVINILTAAVRMINNLINVLTVTIVDVEYEPTTDNRIIFSFAAIDAVIAARWTIDTSVEIEVVTPVEVVNFDDAAILAALGLATEAPVEEVVETVAPVETVTVLGVVYTIRHMVGVDVTFSGRVHASFSDVEGYLFEGTDGTSDFLIRVQAPLCISNAKEWMSRNNETRCFNTRVVVTPTYPRK